MRERKENREKYGESETLIHIQFQILNYSPFITGLSSTNLYTNLLWLNYKKGGGSNQAIGFGV